jgi:hypothetical protein
MVAAIQRFLLVEAVSFLAAAFIHAGAFITGYEHPRARVAEGVIASVLVVGLVASWLRPAWTRTAGLVAQAFALAGTLVGLFTTAIGVGPRTGPDLAYHMGIVLVLVWGLSVAARARYEPPAAGAA